MNLKPPVSIQDHVSGNMDAFIELVEYGDYQCPYCRRAYPIVKVIQERLGNDLKFVFRNFPLSKIHPHAKIAAVSTEAADKQGKFWEMHDIIFENQEKLRPSAIISFGQMIDLNIEQFKNDLADQNLIQKVDSDFESGIRSGVNATPSFFVNGVKYNGSWEEEAFESFLWEKIMTANPGKQEVVLKKDQE